MRMLTRTVTHAHPNTGCCSYVEYVKDLAGLIGYLLEKVYVGNVALMSEKQFHSTEAVQVALSAIATRQHVFLAGLQSRMPTCT